MAELLAGVRTSVARVVDIVETDLSEGQVNAFANTAHMVVQNHLLDRGLSEETLAEIETWLAAHLLSVRDPRPMDEWVNDTHVKYQGVVGMGLDATLYGQNAMLLDTSNTLRRLGTVQTAVLKVF